MSVTLRRARSQDAETLTDLSIRSKRSNGYDDAFMAACRAELTVSEADIAHAEYWIAESGAVLGCACLLADPDGRAGVIHAFFIDPDRQRQGIGRLLWQKLLERARAKGMVELRLDADPNAVPFYQALGFETVGECPSGSIAGRTLPHMMIAL